MIKKITLKDPKDNSQLMPLTVTDQVIYENNVREEVLLTDIIDDSVSYKETGSVDIISKSKYISGLPVGSIFQSAAILSDENYHILNGETINQEDYEDFTRWVKLKIEDNAIGYCTQEEFDNIMNNFGQCGKFVVDDEAKTIRLPKIVKFLQGTVDNSEIGNEIGAGLPNITGDQSEYVGNIGDSNGAFYNNGYNANEGTIDGSTITGLTNPNNSNFKGEKFYFDASRSNPIYGSSETVQPDAIQYPYYIVLADTIKSSMGDNLGNRDIGEIVTSILPIDSVGLHLLDGSKISIEDGYKDFVEYITNLSITNPELFVSEEDWQTSVDAYGICGKFVLKENSIILPLLNNNNRYLIKSYYDNESEYKNWYKIYSDGWCEQGGYIPAGSGGNKTITFLKQYIDNDYNLFIGSYTQYSGTAPIWQLFTYSKTNTEFQTYTDINLTKCWEAKGYIENKYNNEQKYNYIVVSNSIKPYSYFDIKEREKQNSLLIVDYTLSEDASEITIDGLDINADGGIYDVEIQGNSNSSASLRLKTNNDSSFFVNNIFLSSSSSSINTAHNTSISFIGTIYTNTYINLSLTLYNNKCIILTQAANNDRLSYVSSYSNNTFENINSLTFYTDSENILAGTNIKIYKRATNTPTRGNN